MISRGPFQPLPCDSVIPRQIHGRGIILSVHGQCITGGTRKNISKSSGASRFQICQWINNWQIALRNLYIEHFWSWSCRDEETDAVLLIMHSDIFDLQCNVVSKVYWKISLLQHRTLSCSTCTWWSFCQNPGHLVAGWSRKTNKYVSFCKKKSFDRQTQTFVVLSQELYN